jgi:GNAT superfamily N-acetyltransferase
LLAPTWGRDGGTVVEYVSLTTGSIRHEAAPKRYARGMPRHPIPTILIARLAVDSRYQGKRLGSQLLAEALRLAVIASDTAAARLVVVDAIDDSAAGFYRRWGFVDVPENPHRLFRKISEIRRWLKED